MVPKSRRNGIERALPLEPGPNSPHVVYANLEFEGSTIPKRTRRLLQYIDEYLPSWTEERTLQYLKKHQKQFRACLDWASDGFRVDFGPVEDYYESDFLTRWGGKT